MQMYSYEEVLTPLPCSDYYEMSARDKKEGKGENLQNLHRKGITHLQKHEPSSSSYHKMNILEGNIFVSNASKKITKAL